MIPTVAKESLRYAHLVTSALEFTGIAAKRFIMTIRTVGCPITHEAFLDALASIAAKIRNKFRINDKAKWKFHSPELISTAGWTIKFIAFIGTIVLPVATPRGRNAIAIVID